MINLNLNFNNTKFMPKALTKNYEYDEAPPFRINRIRRKYRSIFIKMINSGEIELMAVKSCACGCTDYINISNNDRFALPFRTMVCERCGLVMTNPMISENSLSKYYKEIYYPLVVGVKNGNILNSLVSDTQGEDIFNWVEDALPAKKDYILDVCEIGCASGSNLVDFAKLANIKGIKCSLYGSEYEDRYSAMAKQRGISMFVGNIDVIVKQAVKFDIIILSHVFEHLADLNKTLGFIKELLKPRGIVYIEVPGLMNEKMMVDSYGGNYKDYCVHAHTYNFNLSSLNFILGINGFKPVKCNEAIRASYVLDPDVAIKDPQSNCQFVIEYLKEVAKKTAAGGKSSFVKFKKSIWKLYFRYCQTRIDFSKFKTD